MILTAGQLRPFLRGAVETELRDGALCPYKCTAATREKWGELAEFLKDMAEHTSGIRLEFSTFAEQVSFTVEGGVFDLLVDGQLVCHKEIVGAPGEIGAVLPDKGEPDPSSLHNPELTRVTLVFPNLTRGRVFSLSLSEDGVLRRPEYRESFLFLGDSITQGWTGDYPSLSFAWQVSRFYDADCIIHGVGGAYFRPEVFEAPKDFDPDRVFIALGTNDFSWGFSPEEVRDFTAAYLDKVKAAYGNKKVYCILPIWRGDKKMLREKATYDRCVSYIRAEEEARGFTVIDGMTLVPHDRRFFREDVLHPNDLGFSFYAENLIKAMETAE